MKNITISMEEDVARWLRLVAARDEVSVSRWVGLFLKKQMHQGQDSADGSSRVRESHVSQAPHQASGQALVDAIQASPYREVEFDLDRKAMPVREVKL